MKAPWYIATQAFSPRRGQPWHDYLAWSQLAQLTELVSLDIILCPAILDTLTTEDWEHNVHADCLTALFKDLDYLLARVGIQSERSVLAVMREPSEADCAGFTDARFAFEGFDLVERPGLGVSALSNCGGFPLAFANDELNSVGLLPTYEAAVATQRRLLERYPDGHHAACHVWSIWRLTDWP